ncbi:MAG TPA: phenylalanine--tRNA ligase beta subunit-related protein [Candidatus Azoamicus sp.]
MKIHLTLIKKWFDEVIDTEKLTTKLTDIGFESFIEKNILNISIPTNRPDCTNLLSILNELSKFYKIKNIENNNSLTYEDKNEINIIIKEKLFCPIYCCVIIKNINNNIDTPNDISEHLNLNDINKNNFITDVLNFSTLITGQPMHAYDKEKIGNKIIISKSKQNINVRSINDTTIHIKKNDFIICNNENEILSLPGKIGTNLSKIDKNTRSVLIESAYFNESSFKNSNIHTKSSNMFKHGINLNMIKTSLMYCINLINYFQKTINSSLIEKKYNKYIPKNTNIKIHKSYIINFTGINEKDLYLEKIFNNTGITIKTLKTSWKFKIPSHRKDVQIKENIIAEIIKFIGYNSIKEKAIIHNTLNVSKLYHTKKWNDDKTMFFLLNNGFSEIITYSFVDKNIEKLITSEEKIINIINPMSENNNVLRSSLMQGLMKTFKLNTNKGNEKIKLFEIGNVYIKNKNKMQIKKKLACVCEENNIINENKNYDCDINFFIIKKIIENIIIKIYKNKNLEFKINNDHTNYYLDKNVSAHIFLKKKKIGEIGLLNKDFLESLSIKNNIYFFQIDLNFKNNNNLKIKNISKYPKIKRDISIITNYNESFIRIKNYIENLKIKYLKEIKFKNIFKTENNTKSTHIQLTFQSNKKTLTDNEINLKTFFIIDMIKNEFKFI